MPHRMFLLLPYQHAESAVVQLNRYGLHSHGVAEMMKYAEGHAQCIARVRSFP
jgi:uncharacterized protein (DUF924 family)